MLSNVKIIVKKDVIYPAVIQAHLSCRWFHYEMIRKNLLRLQKPIFPPFLYTRASYSEAIWMFLTKIKKKQNLGLNKL